MNNIIKRGPCPYLNTMANHGYVDTSGVFTWNDLIDKSFEKMNVDKFSLRNFLLLFKFRGIVGNNLVDLSKIQTHNKIEHDVSLVHDDAYPPDNFNPGNKDFSNFIVDIKPKKYLVDKLVSFSKDGKYITSNDLLKYRKYRIEQCKITNPYITFGFRQSFMSFLECSLILLLFGDNDYKVPISTIYNVLLIERFPDDFKPVRNLNLFILSYKILTLVIESFWV